MPICTPSSSSSLCFPILLFLAGPACFGRVFHRGDAGRFLFLRGAGGAFRLYSGRRHDTGDRAGHRLCPAVYPVFSGGTGPARDTAGVVGRTTAAAGHAILFSNLAILASMGALFTVKIAAMRSMALGVMVTAFVLLLLSLSLLPALVAILGTKVNAWRIPIGRRSASSGRWYRFSHRIMRRPVLWLTGSVLLLAALAWSSLQLLPSRAGRPLLPPGRRRPDGTICGGRGGARISLW